MYVCTNYVRKYISLNDLLSIFIAIIRKNNSFLNSDSFMGSNPKIFNNLKKKKLIFASNRSDRLARKLRGKNSE